jgi:hypothetical protein
MRINHETELRRLSPRCQVENDFWRLERIPSLLSFDDRLGQKPGLLRKSADPDLPPLPPSTTALSLPQVFRGVVVCLLLLAINCLLIDRPAPQHANESAFLRRSVDGTTCRSDLLAPLEEHVPVHFNLSLHNLFEGDGLAPHAMDHANAAVCEFVKTFETMHYPHGKSDQRVAVLRPSSQEDSP